MTTGPKGLVAILMPETHRERGEFAKSSLSLRALSLQETPISAIPKTWEMSWKTKSVDSAPGKRLAIGSEDVGD